MGKENRKIRPENIRERKLFIEQISKFGTLSKKEIKELVSFEFNQEPKGLKEQIKKYYLKTKLENPEKAKKMKKEVKKIKKDNIEGLVNTLYNYLSGFVINYKGKSYSMHNNKLYVNGKEYKE